MLVKNINYINLNDQYLYQFEIMSCVHKMVV